MCQAALFRKSAPIRSRRAPSEARKLAQKIEVFRARLEITAFDPTRHLDHRRVDRGGAAAFFLAPSATRPFRSSTSLWRPLIQSCSTVVLVFGSMKPFEQRVEQHLDQSIGLAACRPASARRSAAPDGRVTAPVSSASWPERSINSRMPGSLTASTNRQTKNRGRHQRRRIADELHPLGGADVVDDLDTVPDVAQQLGDLGSRALRSPERCCRPRTTSAAAANAAAQFQGRTSSTKSR